jgi:hypothetical protein
MPEVFELTGIVIDLSQRHTHQRAFEVSGQGRAAAGQPAPQSSILFAFFSKLCSN